MVTLNSVPEVINVLGGMPAVADLTGRKSNVVWNWKDRKVFPAYTYAVLKAALHAKGADAPDNLWKNMVSS